jgi:hypothetical protein
VTSIGRDTEQDLMPWEPGTDDIVYSLCARLLIVRLDTVQKTVFRRMELSMVSSDFCPPAREVITHEIQVVEISGCALEVDVLQAILTGRKGRCQEILRAGEALPDIM